ncbi:MAG: 3-deoxy-7-phosphoheptulonate synthase [Chlamydiae bacterium]|nr:3-deoxy-7-phosphoheptulonate synthase [Chlamydiota bacterium]
MLIQLTPSATAEDIHGIQILLDHLGQVNCLFESNHKKMIGLEKGLKDDQIKMILQLKGIEKIHALTTPYKLASIAFKKERTVIQARGVAIGGNKIVLIAGPCAIESKKQLSAITQKLRNTKTSIIRASAYKPRSSPYSFQGLNEEGLKIHKEVQKEHRMPIETEVTDIRDVAIVAEHVDIIRIGARNMQNFDLLKEVGKAKKPVILKRGLSATVEEWLLAAEYIMMHGNPEVILCERGIRTFETSMRNTLDLSSVALVKQLSHLPVIVDPSHAAGRKDIIPAISKAAIAAGADGLLIEVHHNPTAALCDGKQALLIEELASLSVDLEKIAIAIGRSL